MVLLVADFFDKADHHLNPVSQIRERVRHEKRGGIDTRDSGLLDTVDLRMQSGMGGKGDTGAACPWGRALCTALFGVSS